LQLDKNTLTKNLKNVFFVVIGTLILSVGTAVFLLPFDLITGGLSGYAIVLSRFIPESLLTVDAIIAVLSWATFFLGFIVLGKGFAAKTLISTIVYPIGISLVLRLVDPNVLGGFFCIAQSRYGDISILLAAVFGGVLQGLGCALSFVGGGSTGGTDIIAFVICKIFKRIKSSVMIFIVDAAAIVLGVFVVKDLTATMLGIVTAFVGSLVIDKVFVGGSKAYVASIITDAPEAINELIIEKLERTTTMHDAIGGYSHKPKKVVMVSFSMNQYSELMNIISRCDADAFMTISKAHEINGEGWTR